MILEDSLVKLVKDVGCETCEDINVRKVGPKGLPYRAETLVIVSSNTSPTLLVT